MTKDLALLVHKEDLNSNHYLNAWHACTFTRIACITCTHALHTNKLAKINLNESEIDAIETYIDNSAPPDNVNLNNQYSQNLNNMCKVYVFQQCESYGFTDMLDVLASSREGSNHPLRSDARRVLEYYDAVWNVYVNVANEVNSTREDVLKDFEHYSSQIPTPQQAFID